MIGAVAVLTLMASVTPAVVASSPSAPSPRFATANDVALDGIVGAADQVRALAASLPSLGLAAPSAVAAAENAFAQARQRYLAAAPQMTPRQVALAVETTDLMSTILEALGPVGGIAVPPALCGPGIAGAGQVAPPASLPTDSPPGCKRHWAP